MTCKLSDICFLVGEKIEVCTLTVGNYVSTENMLPNKAGITTAATLPTIKKTQKYRKNDILISNIRPYFKKIWAATDEGGCSNDVLVFRAKEGVSSSFLYYVLSSDDFFKYATATSKGTKMPRGDKKAIMLFGIPSFELGVQRRISSILAALDARIEINNRINDNLAA